MYEVRWKDGGRDVKIVWRNRKCGEIETESEAPLSAY